MRHYAISYFPGDSTDYALTDNADDFVEVFFCTADNDDLAEREFYLYFPEYHIICVYRDIYGGTV